MSQTRCIVPFEKSKHVPYRQFGALEALGHWRAICTSSAFSKANQWLEKSLSVDAPFAFDIASRETRCEPGAQMIALTPSLINVQ